MDISCLKYLKKHVPHTKIIKGRPRHPQSQGCVERSNGTFKVALEKWIESKGGKEAADWTMGAYIVSMNINLRSHHGRSLTVAHESYFGLSKECKDGIYVLVDEAARDEITTEHAYLGVKELSEILREEDGASKESVMQFIQVMNKLYEEEEKINDSELEIFDAPGLRREIVQEFVEYVRNEESDWERFVQRYLSCANVEDAGFNRDRATNRSSKNDVNDSGVNQKLLDIHRSIVRDKARQNCVAGQIAQAEKVNKKRRKNFVDELPVGAVVRVDIALRDRNVKIFGIIYAIEQGERKAYCLNTMYGKIQESLPRERLIYQPDLTADLIGIKDSNESNTLQEVAQLTLSRGLLPSKKKVNK